MNTTWHTAMWLIVFVLAFLVGFGWGWRIAHRPDRKNTLSVNNSQSDGDQGGGANNLHGSG